MVEKVLNGRETRVRDTVVVYPTTSNVSHSMKNDENVVKMMNMELVPKLSHNSRIEVIRGFYKGYTGMIKSYIIKNNRIVYTAEVVQMDNTEIQFYEDELRLKPKILGLF